jgi:hypothetical protein
MPACPANPTEASQRAACAESHLAQAVSATAHAANHRLRVASAIVGSQLGTGQSNANYNAGSPWLAANSGSNIGNFLPGLGNGASNPFSSLGGY